MLLKIVIICMDVAKVHDIQRLKGSTLYSNSCYVAQFWAFICAVISFQCTHTYNMHVTVYLLIRANGKLTKMVLRWSKVGGHSLWPIKMKANEIK